jgi:peptidoglycan hydrolase-like protein with peptidoglycan-binding domain
MGWSGGPHLCIPPTPDTILVLNSLLVHGTHTPSWNSFSFGVETVGEFEREPFGGATKDNLVAALAMLHQKCGFDPADYHLGQKGLHFHKEDRATTHKSCPGKNMIKSELVQAVQTAMGKHPVELPEPVQVPHTHDVPLASQEADTSKLNAIELTSVYWLQAALNQWHPSLHLVLNGNYDTPTETAIRQFQIIYDLRNDGVGGPLTRLALKHVNA